MTVRSLVKGWNEFFFKPQPPTPLALFRILYGLLTIANLLMLKPEWLMWYGPHAFMSMQTMHAVDKFLRINFFEILPQTGFWIDAFFWFFLLVAVFQTIGYMSRFSCVSVFLCMMSIHSRNPYILNGGDQVMQCMGFFLMFAPAGAVLSVDRWRRIRQGKESADQIPLCRPWAQRLIQIQASVLYFSTFYFKSQGPWWINGTAFYYASRLLEFQHFPMPAIHNLYLLRALTWSTLLIEFSLGVLVWFRDLRYPVLLGGLCLHMGIEYAMVIPLFEWASVATYVTFIYPEDLSRAGAWLRHRIGPQLAELWNSSLKWHRGRTKERAAPAKIKA